ncbi:type II toxin-antitoxin system RelE family toxin [Microbacterium maritypicum]
MTYSVVVAPAAIRQLRKMDAVARRRIQAAIDLLAENPRPPAATRLVNFEGEWRVRVGDYRIVYDIHDRELLVLVLSTAHRREVYR